MTPIAKIKWTGTISLAMLGISGLGMIKALPFVPRSLEPSILWGWGLALFLGLSGFWTLLWSLETRKNLFLNFWMGGMLFRLFFIGAAAWVITRWNLLDGTASLAALALGYLILSLVETGFLVKASQAASS